MKYHPILVHFPIAFYFLEFFLLAVWAKKDDREYKRFSDLVFRIGYFSMIAAMAGGIYDAGGFGGIRGLVKPHALAAIGVFGIYTIRAGFFYSIRKTPERFRWIQVLGALLGVAAVAYAGYLGGRLVYS